ncbi:MAG: shikimate kinase [Vicingaceae bacterium]
MNIFLVGFMGSGKSVTGKKLAKRLNLQFLDLDREIEEVQGEAIPEIFKNRGEPYFRELEGKTLFNLAGQSGFVIALGGGTPCSQDNWDFIENNGLSIYLKEKADVLFGRLRKEKALRPLISDLGDAELKSYIHNTLKSRSIFYDQAVVCYDKSKMTWSELLEIIETYIK